MKTWTPLTAQRIDARRCNGRMALKDWKTSTHEAYRRYCLDTARREYTAAARIAKSEPLMRPATMLANARVGGAGLALGLGKGRDLIEVHDYPDASRLYRRAVEEAERVGRGGSRFPDGVLYDTRGTEPVRVATVSYNGCVWALGKWKPGVEPLFDPAGSRRVIR